MAGRFEPRWRFTTVRSSVLGQARVTYIIDVGHIQSTASDQSGVVHDGGRLHDRLIDTFDQNPITGWHAV